jgi:hypothetical protein
MASFTPPVYLAGGTAGRLRVSMGDFALITDYRGKRQHDRQQEENDQEPP